MHRRPAAFLLALAALALPAAAQSFNVDWGSPGTVPPPFYAGVGVPGVWNNFPGMVQVQRYPLVGLDGAPIAADIMNIGFDAVESADIPGATGGDEALLEDCFVSYNDPVDGCLFIRFMEPGEYRVIMYGLAPDDGGLLSALRIDQNPDGPELVGGSWGGQHEDGVSYMEQTATVGGDGRLDLHSGVPSGFIRSVLNGLQVIRVEPCPADLTGEGVLDFFDVAAFLDAFSAQDPVADFTGEGVFDFFDVAGFLDAFSAGCR